MKKRLLKMLSITLVLALLTPDVAVAAARQTETEAVSDNNIANVIESVPEETQEAQVDVTENNDPEIERQLTYHDAEDPVPVMTRSEESVYANRGSLPSSYSSVTAGKVPELKDQGSYGTCWAFAAVGASESGLISRGLAGTNIDLSERHLAYYFYEKGTTGDILGGTTGDYNKVLGGDRYNYMNRGGNSLYTMWHLASWAGLADESKAPYSGMQTALPKTTADVYGADSYHLQNAYIVNKANRDVVKQLIMDYGSLAFAYYSSNSHDYDNVQNDSYYFNIENSGTNHAVQVVGWDDNFSRDKFTITPPGDGAWLIKNSWGGEGGNYAQNGYFWLSYYDTSISDNFFAYVCEKGDNYDNIYQYDGASGTRYITTKYAANVYTAKANAGGIEKIEAVGIGSYSNGVGYTVEIYTDLTNPSDPASGTKVASQKGTLTYSGYHTIPLKMPVSIEEGQKFSIVFNFDQERSVYVDYSYGSNWIEFVTNEALGTSFYKMDYTGAKWIDAVDGSSATFRIKAYTSNALPDASEPLQSIILDKTALTLDKGATAQLKVTYRPSYTTDDKTVRWSTSNAGVAAVDGNGKITAMGAGTATITAVCGSKRATCTVTVQETGRILSSSLQLVSHTTDQIVCRMDTVTDKKVDIKYRWLIYDIALGQWTVEAEWRKNYQWFTWSPKKEGGYLILCEVETVSGSAKDSSVIGYIHSVYSDVKIIGKCQMPYTGPGGGYLIGVETNKNPGQKLQYELLIMDCSLYAEGKPPWIWSTGKMNVGEGNAFWAVWQPEYGYYWTYFRVYDENGNLIDDQCYGFANV